MFFCEKCRYAYDVTKDVKSKQLGGKNADALKNIFTRFKSNQPIDKDDLEKLTVKDITNDERYDALPEKTRKRLISNIKNTDKNFFVEEAKSEDSNINNAAYFICKFCKNPKLIKPGTLIYSKNYSGNTVETIDYSNIIHDPTLSRTRTYICKNAKCSTHKNPQDKEAILTKNTSDQIVYVCTICKMDWISAV